MAVTRTDRDLSGRTVVVRGGGAAERSQLIRVLEAADFSVTDLAGQPDEALTVDMPTPAGHADSKKGAATGGIDWAAFAHGVLKPVAAAGTGAVAEAAFFLINLDHFQRLRSMLGSEVAAQLLHEVTGRLSRVIRDQPGARLMPMGGDEFAILVPHMDGGEAASRFANMLLRTISHPYDEVAPQAYVTARIAGVFYPKDAADIDSLVSQASAVVHAVSREGRNSVHFYAEGAASLAAERFELEARLHQAIRNNELEVFYQPQLSFANGAIIGAEALVRWRQPDFGTVPAEIFVALAEDLGLIAELGTWVLTTAAAECRRWQRPGQPPLRVSINISSYQFRHLDMVAVVRKALADTGLDPDCLTLEVTESLVLSDIESTLESLRELRAMGIHVALDDFGTGYSSLSYLKTLALDGLKLDRSFISGLPTDRGDLAVTEAVIRMARALHLRVTAEGVETEAQRDCLARLGCDMYQGFLASEALPAAEFAKLLGRRDG